MQYRLCMLQVDRVRSKVELSITMVQKLQSDIVLTSIQIKCIKIIGAENRGTFKGLQLIQLTCIIVYQSSVSS